LKVLFKHIILLILLLSIHNSIIAQNYKLQVLIDSTSNALDLSKTRKFFNSKNQIIEYLDSISNNLNLHGYINNYYELKDENKITTASFNLFDKIDSVQIHISIGQLDLSKFNTPFKFITPELIELSTVNTVQFLNEISNYFEKRGNSFTRANLTRLIQKNSKIRADLTINVSQKRKIDEVIIKGYSNISKKYLEKSLHLNKKTSFNLEVILDATKIINSIPFIEQTKQPEVLFTKDSTFLYLYLEKKTMNSINGIIGFSTNENSKIILNGDLDLQLSNVFNGGENFNLNWKSYENTSLLKTNLDLPVVLNSDVSFKGNFILTKQDTLYTSSQGKLNVIYNINHFHSIGGIVDFENSNVSFNNLIETYEDFKKTNFGITYTFSKLLNNGKSPFTFSLSYLKGKKNNNNKQENLNLLIENNFNLNTKNNIYLKLTGQVLNSSNISKNEMYKIGGFNSLRGFDELSILTSKYALTNLEYQYYLNKKNFFYSITDFAFANTIDNLNNESLLGLGLGYVFTTKNSILNFSYVTGNTLNSDVKNQKSKVYLNISYLF